MFIPEIIIHNTIADILDFLKMDFDENATDETKTLLYALTKTDDYGADMKLGSADYYEQAKKIFVRGEDDIKKISVSVGYDLERSSFPTIHIVLPSENESQGGIGKDEGYLEPDVDEIQKFTRAKLTKTYTCTYNLIISSPNQAETVLIYHVLKNMLTSFSDHLELSGIRLSRYAGSDVMLNSNLTPDTSFNRSLSMTVTYETSVPVIRWTKYAKLFKFIILPESTVETIE